MGIHKCHKTIKDALRNGTVFHADGTETLFLILRKTTELRSSEIGRYKYQGKGAATPGGVVGLHQIMSMLKVHNTLRTLFSDCVIQTLYNNQCSNIFLLI